MGNKVSFVIMRFTLKFSALEKLYKIGVLL